MCPSHLSRASTTTAHSPRPQPWQPSRFPAPTCSPWTRPQAARFSSSRTPRRSSRATSATLRPSPCLSSRSPSKRSRTLPQRTSPPRSLRSRRSLTRSRTTTSTRFSSLGSFPRPRTQQRPSRRSARRASACSLFCSSLSSWRSAASACSRLSGSSSATSLRPRRRTRTSASPSSLATPRFLPETLLRQSPEPQVSSSPPSDGPC
eukprot:Amastigsp_a841220_227.p6 type:complete len:205 gc:universal Amastigsp_a841220_227:2922-3536(+)